MRGWVSVQVSQGWFWGGRGGGGGLPSLSPADFAVSGIRRGLAFWSPADLAFSFISCPHPRPPSPPGKGENQGYFMQGAPPLHPRAEPEGHEQGANHAPSGACLRRRGGGGVGGAQGGLPSLSPAIPAFSLLSCPHPPTPSSGEGGSPKVYFAGASPRRPCIRPLAARTVPAKQVLRRGACPRRRGGGGLAVFQKRARAVAPSIKIREKFWGVGDSFKSPRRSLHQESPEPNDRADSEPQHYLLWIEVQGGSGDSFKSPPAFPVSPFLPFPSFPVTASMGCQAGGSRGLRRSRRRWRRRGR